MLVPQNTRKIIEKTLIENFFKTESFIEIVEFCKQENNFEYIETIKSEIKYNEYIENAFNKLCVALKQHHFTTFMICYDKFIYDEETEEIGFSMILGLKNKLHKNIDVRIIYDYENEMMMFEEYEF